jgi:hypothetical protein
MPLFRAPKVARRYLADLQKTLAPLESNGQHQSGAYARLASKTAFCNPSLLELWQPQLVPL